MVGLNTLMEREELRQTLANFIVSVTFTKADNTIRTMLCTTNGPMISEAEKKANVAITQKSNTKRPNWHNRSSADTMAVWDCEKAAWRSFRWDSVLCTIVQHQ
jgi:hypothetical protein